MKQLMTILLLMLSSLLWAQEKPAGPVVTSDLAKQMSLNTDNELIRVNIRLTQQYDARNLMEALAGSTREARRAVVVAELKSFRDKSQKGILAYLDSKQKLNEAELIHSLWITNVITCMATNQVINELAQRSDIASIDWDETRNLLLDEEQAVKEGLDAMDGGKEITYNVNIMDVPAVWDLGFYGEGVTVCVLDTGVNYNHSDLEDHMWIDPAFPNHGYDFANNDNDPMDGHGHGTHCAGTVAGDGTAGSQTGMAPEATVMALKVLDDGGGGNESNVWAAIEFVVEHNGDIISMSLGWQHSWGCDRTSWRNSFDNALAAGVVASVAAGNEGDQQGSYPIPDNVRTPGDCPPPWLNPDQTTTGGISGVVCIGATDSNDNLASFSSRGPVTWSAINPFNDYPYNPGMGLIRPDVSAPGVDVKSCDAFNPNGYTWMSGTSMATPGTAGVMALLLSKNINLMPEEISEALEMTAVDYGATGKDNNFGAGRVDALEAFNFVNFPGPVYNSHTINDPNSNGEVEAGESIQLSIEMFNGSDSPYNNVVVTLSEDSPYITVTDNSENYGNFTSGQYITITDGFAFDVAADTPGMESIPFTVSATDGNETWTSKFYIVTYGPSIHLGNVTINDPSGNNNGRLDPGETADVIIKANNTGQVGITDVIVEASVQSGFVTLNNTQVNIPSLPAAGSVDAAFSVTVDNSAPVGTGVPFHFDMASGAFNDAKDIVIPIGLIVEDWESGNMTQFDWETGGNADWAVSTQTPFEGTYCIKSGDIDDNESNWLSLEYEVSGDDSISFWYKVESESSYDFLTFYIDNAEQGSWSGMVAWTYAAYEISEGTHTLKWEYSKDVSVSTGGDCAWVDFIELPAQAATTAFAGPDGAVCENDTYACAGTASLYNSLGWTTSGDGTFSNSTILNPVYTPGTNDISNGTAVLTLTAYGSSNNVSDNMTLTIYPPATAFAGDDTGFCSNEVVHLVFATASNYVALTWSTSGDGTFVDNTVIDPEYNPGTGDIANGSVTLTLTAEGNASCSDVTDDIVVALYTEATAYAGGDSETCSNESFAIVNATAQDYASLEWSTSGDGTFDDAGSLNATYTPGTNDASAGTATLTLTAYGNGTCQAATSEMALTIHAVATAFAGEDDVVAEGESYVLSGAQATDYSSVQWTTSGDGTFDNANTVNPAYTPGTNDIAAEEAILTLTAVNADCGNVSDQITLGVSPSGVYENTAGFVISVSPNPNHGTFTLEMKGDREVRINISIYNPTGKAVYESKNVMVDNEYRQTLQLNLDKGIYMLRLEGQDMRVNRKIVVE